MSATLRPQTGRIHQVGFKTQHVAWLLRQLELKQLASRPEVEAKMAGFARQDAREVLTLLPALQDALEAIASATDEELTA